MAGHARRCNSRPALAARGRGEPGRYVNLGEGDIDWPRVMAALVRVGYNGFVSPEIGGDPNDPDKINKVSRALDKILSLA